jgi:protease II
MGRRNSTQALGMLAFLSIAQGIGWSQSATLGSPPVAPVRPVIDDYFGTKVTDPYRYMENLSNPEVQSWIKAQNDYARAVLASIPGRAKMRDRIRELDQSAPAFVSDLRHVPGDLYFYQKLPAGADIAKLYMSMAWMERRSSSSIRTRSSWRQQTLLRERPTFSIMCPRPTPT